MGLIDSIIGAESGGNPTAQNPNSSASGPSQFLDSTWLSTVRAHRPELAGQSDAALLSLKTDPQLSRDMTAAYAGDNQAILSKAGLPVTAGTTYLAHFAGPQGAVKILQADPGALAGDILGPAVVKANPFLAGMTAQGLQAWAAKKVGATSPMASRSPQGGPAGSPTAVPEAMPQPIAGQPQAYQQQQSAAPDISALMPAPAGIPPIFYAPRHGIDLAKLRATFSPPTLYGKS